MRTDKQIAEYMAYYKDKPKDERKWALENLAKLEKKSPAEIQAICERAAKPKQKEEKKPRNEGGRHKLPREEIRAELLAGGTLMSVSEKLGVSHTTVGRKRLLMVKEGLLKAGRPYPGRKKDKQPEAYPGQINDDEPEIEDDGADMFVLLDKMREWVEANFGEHIPIGMRCCNKTEGAQYHFRDPRTGKIYQISLFKLWEEDKEKEEE